MMTLKRHHQILERARAEAQAAVTPQQTFATALQAAEPAAAPPAPEPARVLTAAAQPAAAPALPPDQAALLATSLGAALPETPVAAPAAAATATPELTGSQMDTLMAAFGQPQLAAAAPAPEPIQPAPESMPQTEAAMAATAIPEAQADNLVFFPVNNANMRGIANPADAARQANASDTYLRAMQQMERNLGSYGAMSRNGH